MVVEKSGLDVPEPWRSQGFVRVWMVNGDPMLTCFSREQADRLAELLSEAANASSNAGIRPSPSVNTLSPSNYARESASQAKPGTTRHQ